MIIYSMKGHYQTLE